MFSSLQSPLTRATYILRSYPRVASVVARLPLQPRFNSSTKDEGDDSDKSDLEEWVPLNRPLVGDRGYHNLNMQEDIKLQEEEQMSEEEELAFIEEELKRMELQEQNAFVRAEKQVDWLATRRETLKGKTIEKNRHDNIELEVKKHTLFSDDEITGLLVSMGAQNAAVVHDDQQQQRMGGARGMVFVTASSASHVRLLGDQLVLQLRRRRLQDVGVIGAHLGAEGSEDKDETWLVVDCQNYIVHIMDEYTRKVLKLEEFWSPNCRDDLLRDTNVWDEDREDEYVAKNPVPADYGSSNMDWDETLQRLQRNQLTAPHRPTENRPRMNRSKKKQR